MTRWTLDDIAKSTARISGLPEVKPVGHTPLATTKPPAPPLAHRSKYNSQRTYYDGRWFDSKREAERYKELRLLEQSGQITDLRCQPKYGVNDANGEHAFVYIADFRYVEAGKLVVEDVKSKPTMTQVWRNKIKLFKAQFRVDVTIIT